MKSIAYGAIRPLKRILNNIYVLLFLNGFFFASMALLYTEGNYESQIFKSLAGEIKGNSPSIQSISPDTIVLRCLHLTNQLEKSRSILFGKRPVSSFKADYLSPLTVDLMTGQQACGGFSYVLGRLLQEMQIDFRFAQMKVNGMFGGHILVEAKLQYGWVVLDPLYDLYFVKPNGKLASFEDVKNDWAYFKTQVPEDYKEDYKYEAVRYTNWEKIPILMPALKSIMNLTMGEEATENYSIRNLFLRKFDMLFYSTIVLYGFFLSLTVRKYYLRRKNARLMKPEFLFPKTVAPASTEHVLCTPVAFTMKL